VSADLQKWFAEYVELMFPDNDVIDRDQRENEARVHTARVRACWIVERLIESGQYRSLS
jgi:hypothetical protein